MRLVLAVRRRRSQVDRARATLRRSVARYVNAKRQTGPAVVLPERPVAHTTQPNGLAGDWVCDNADVVLVVGSCVSLKGSGIAPAVYARWSYGDVYRSRTASRSLRLAAKGSWAKPGTITWKDAPKGCSAPSVVTAFAQWTSCRPNAHPPSGERLPLGDTKEARTLWLASLGTHFSPPLPPQPHTSGAP